MEVWCLSTEGTMEIETVIPRALGKKKSVFNEAVTREHLAPGSPYYQAKVEQEF